MTKVVKGRNPKAKVGRAPKVVKGAKGRNPKAKVGRAPKVVKGWNPKANEQSLKTEIKPLFST
jgi:hypothetical protein